MVAYKHGVDPLLGVDGLAVGHERGIFGDRLCGGHQRQQAEVQGQ